MKKFASLLLTVVLLATMLSVFAVPALADAAAVAEIVEAEAVVENPDPEANQSESDRQAQEDRKALKNAAPTEDGEDGEGSTLSEGGLMIIVGVACLAVGFLVAMFIFKKKKKPALAEGTDNTDEE